MSDRYGTSLTRLVEEHPMNAALAWASAALIAAIGVVVLAGGNLTWGLSVLVVALLAVIPGPLYGSLETTLPWELIALVAGAVAWRTVLPGSEAALYAVIAGAAILIAAELHLFTRARLSHLFVVALVAIATAAVAGAWAMISWAADSFLGTAYISTNTELMWDLTTASVVGVLAGILFDLYVRYWEARFDDMVSELAVRGGAQDG
jgi:hypothetical protein